MEGIVLSKRVRMDQDSLSTYGLPGENGSTIPFFGDTNQITQDYYANMD
jgi:hypothetical protein